MPTRNRHYSIKYAIRSLISQTYGNWELILVDDHSTNDDTYCYILKVNDSRIKYYRMPERIGSTKARNYGIMQSNGDIILMMDDDIWLEKRCLEEISNCVRNGADAVSFRAFYAKWLDLEKEYEPQRWFPLTKKVDILSPESIPYFMNEQIGEMFIGKNPGTYTQIKVCHAVFAVKKDILKDIGVYADGYGGNNYREETDLQLRITNKFKMIFTPNTFCIHLSFKRGGGGQSISTYKYEYYVLRNHMRFLRKFYPYNHNYRFFLFIIYRYVYSYPKKVIVYLLNKLLLRKGAYISIIF